MKNSTKEPGAKTGIDRLLEISGEKKGLLFISAILSVIFLYAGTMASHISAFKILYGLRVGLAVHLAKQGLYERLWNLQQQSSGWSMKQVAGA